MKSTLVRLALSTACAVSFAGAGGPALADDADVTAAASALTTKLSSDDIFPVNGTNLERQLSLSFATKAAAPCVLTVHREAISTYPFVRPGTMLVASAPATYYMLPLDTMSTALSVANAQTTEFHHDPRAGNAGDPTHFTYSEDTTLPLAGLKTADVSPVAVASNSTPMKYPTYTDQAAAKAALAALAKAAASCGGPSATK